MLACVSVNFIFTNKISSNSTLNVLLPSPPLTLLSLLSTQTMVFSAQIISSLGGTLFLSPTCATLFPCCKIYTTNKFPFTKLIH